MQMDFLDPRRKRAHRRRLMIGYALMSVMVAIGTMIILYLAYGFDIDRKTGTLIQNGIVYVDSKPQGASIYVNEVLQGNRTDTRMVLPAGTYTIRLEAENYRHWERTFMLEGGQIHHLVYPYLIPNQLITSDIEQYDIVPKLVTQSPDRRWVLVQRPGQTYQFDVFDLNDPESDPEQIIIPPSILTEPSAEASLKVIEWSNDNRHLVIERTYEGASEFIVLDREEPGESVNINTTFGISPKSVTLRNKKSDQYFYLEKESGVLRIADAGSRTISAPVADEVIDYRSYGDDIVLYATTKGARANQADFKVVENGKTYDLKSVSRSDRYVMDVSRYDDDWYYVVGGSKENTAFVYKNPLAAIKDGQDEHLRVLALMRLDNPRFVSFSANTQFIGLQSGSTLLTLDLEFNRQYRTEMEQEIPLEQQIKWMDGHRYIYSHNEQSYIVDFDGSNHQTLVTSRLTPGPFFDRDYDNVFTFEESKNDGNKKAFTMTVIDD